MISENTLELLEYPKLLGILAEPAHSPATHQAILNIRPMQALADIKQRQRLVEEIRRLTIEGNPLCLSPFSDLRPFLDQARPEGAVLEALELSAIMPVLRLSSTLSDQIKEAESIPNLKTLTQKLKGFPDLLTFLERALDQEGNILDQASPWLAELRKEIRQLEAQIRRKLEEIIREPRVAPFLQDDFVTQRSGRWVIPVRMDSKTQVPGVVHDVSRTGETAFVEPLNILSLANQLENLMAEQKAEEIRILKELSTMIRKRADDLEKEQEILVHLDLLFCLAHLADRLHMETPEVQEGAGIRLIKARHPLLALSFAKKGTGKEVVPLTLDLGDSASVMVITGVNAGGKTIALKTTGLLLLMALSGMPVPADSASRFPLLHDLPADIGDEQSIESSLSTFSAHISRITEILSRADEKTLVLMDELGTSTDPVEGAAIACAVLKNLQDKGALVMATTHLTEIKGFVHRTDGMVNASMEFDQKTLRPLYQLRMGEPGQSHAIEIARQYGLPESILETAHKLLSGREEGFEQLVADLNQKRRDYEIGLEELTKQKELLTEEGKKIEDLQREAERQSKERLVKAYQEALDVAAQTKRQMNNLLEEIKKKDKADRRQALQKLREEEESLSKKLRAVQGLREDSPAIESLQEGDRVYLRSLGCEGEVLALYPKQNRLKVRAEGREIEVPVSDIGLKAGKYGLDKKPFPMIRVSRETALSRINLIGHRVDEALSLIEPFLNHASLAGLQEITIVHGVGTGILAKSVRDYLKGHPLVNGFRKGERPEGGEGVTVVSLE
ncbi:MAG: endonuclease MutS2 [Desulfobacca sp.]|nr:endonuclease MutS2 [Desulfobacca sp.]